MQYRELLEKLSKMTPEQLDLDVSVLLIETDEVFAVANLVTEWSPQEGTVEQVQGVLDDNHPYLTIDA